MLVTLSSRVLMLLMQPYCLIINFISLLLFPNSVKVRVSRLCLDHQNSQPSLQGLHAKPQRKPQYMEQST